MVLTSPERRTLSPSRTLPPGMAPTLAERKERATTLPRLQMDEPMFSRNIPSAFSITSCPSDKEELSFSNRWDQFYEQCVVLYCQMSTSYFSKQSVFHRPHMDIWTAVFCGQQGEKQIQRSQSWNVILLRGQCSFCLNFRPHRFQKYSYCTSRTISSQV